MVDNNEDMIWPFLNKNNSYLLSIFIGIIAGIIGVFFFPDLPLHANILLVVILVLILMFVAILILYIIQGFTSNINYKKQSKEETEKIIQDIRDRNYKIDEFFTQISLINVEQLKKYYDIIGNQADRSFNWAIIISIIGFCFIGYAIYISLLNNQSETYTTNIVLLTWISGAVIEFISTICFYLYTQSQKFLLEHKNSLLDVQNVLLSLWMVNEMKDDPEKRVDILKTIIEKLCEKNK